MPACPRPSCVLLALAFATACAGAATRSLPDPDPHTAVNELLAVDRQFSAAARTRLIPAISAMLADDVMIPTRGEFVRDKAAAVDALRNAFGPAPTSVAWTPIRGGVSADGQHGFTFGYMTVARADSTRTPLKYLSYWVKRPDGWRVVAYKIAHRPAGEVSLSMMPPALPPRMLSPPSDPATIAHYSESLIAAERAFSDRAQEIGLGPAFEEKGSADAVNIGGRDSPAFIVGSRAIGRAVSGGTSGRPSPVSWGADRAIVASSGDLGVTFGVIRPNARPADAARQTGIPFFTIWRRPRPTDPWRYIAE